MSHEHVHPIFRTILEGIAPSRIATTEAVASVTRIPAPDVADKGASCTPTLMSGGDLDQPLLHGMDSTLPQTSAAPGRAFSPRVRSNSYFDADERDRSERQGDRIEMFRREI